MTKKVGFSQVALESSRTGLFFLMVSLVKNSTRTHISSVLFVELFNLELFLVANPISMEKALNIIMLGCPNYNY